LEKFGVEHLMVCQTIALVLITGKIVFICTGISRYEICIKEFPTAIVA